MHPRLSRLARTLCTCALLALALAWLPGAARAQLPAQVNGQPVPSLAPMLEDVTPAVVNISSRTRVHVRDPFFNDPVFRQFFGRGVPRERIERSLGSGVIVNAAKGYVLTNNHVVGGADAITVTLQDGRSYQAKLVGADPETDIAVLKIPAENLQQLPLADSSKTRVGDFVVAVGDPFGLGQTVTSGIVSALNRTGLGDTYQNFIQTDASINPGNSGGALVNLHGELIGINSMIYSPSGASAGIGFAIPSNLVHEVMQQLLTYGKVRRGSLGVEVQEITPHIADALGVDANAGAVVTDVADGSPAAQAGLQVGDVLETVNGKPVHDRGDLRNIEGLLPVGSAVKLAVRHDGQVRTLDARMAPEQLAQAKGAALDPRLDGASLADLSREKAAQGMAGVAVVAVGTRSRAARSGLRGGDVILGVNQRRSTSLKQLKALLAGPPPRQLMLVILRDHRVHYLLAR